ncbi:MAG: PPOX class F420-dependent oxidoreductase [Nitrososphaera sp.]|uniref:PPOX class F420-dependent oxidoreductase n=1 Tax=Nitrososphaera sp. TaxID=1971748 RepID=UPI003D701552
MANEMSEIMPLLHDKNFVFVATIMEDGSPQITPTWVDVEQDGTVLVNTAMGRVKQKNVTRDPRIAVSVIDKNNPYHMASIRGKVVEQTRQGADEHIDKMAKKYLGMDRYPGRSPGEERVILRIKPEKVAHTKPR